MAALGLGRLLLLLGACRGQAAAPRAASVAMSLEGGGFRAQSVGAGLFAGLLASLGQRHGTAAPTLAASGLLKRVDHFSSNSGSSWFMSSLVYSPRYAELVEAMAASPSTAAEQYRVNWTTPWLKATGVDLASFSLKGLIARDVLTKVLGKGDEDFLYTLCYFLATGLTWQNFVGTLLNSTASMDMTVRLGSPVNPWAEGKVWLVDHTVLLPSGARAARLFQGDLGLPEVNYVAQSSSAVPLLLPARFSAVLGAGVGSSAPHPYVPASAVPSPVDLNVTAAIIPGVIDPSALSAPLGGGDLSGGVLAEGAGSLPVLNVAAASSAFAGIAPVEGVLVDEALQLTDADLTPWVSNQPGGAAFTEATALVEGLRQPLGVSQAAVDALAARQVHGLIDGGFTEGTGLAHAVAAGAGEVIMVLNSNATNDPFYAELMFKDGPAPLDPGSSSVIFPVFQSPTAATVREQFAGFHRLALPPGSQYLQVFAVGTVQAVTAANRYFGIEPGRSVTIHVINLGSSLSIGQFENFDHYNALVQEVAESLVLRENAPYVQGALLPMIMGPSLGASAVVV